MLISHLNVDERLLKIIKNTLRHENLEIFVQESREPFKESGRESEEYPLRN